MTLMKKITEYNGMFVKNIHTVKKIVYYQNDH